jgi:hypothetical protein
MVALVGVEPTLFLVRSESDCPIANRAVIWSARRDLNSRELAPRASASIQARLRADKMVGTLSNDLSFLDFQSSTLTINVKCPDCSEAKRDSLEVARLRGVSQRIQPVTDITGVDTPSKWWTP